MSRSLLYARVKSLTNQSVNEFVRIYRLNKAARLLANKENLFTVSEVAYDVGFKNISHFSRCFSEQFKISPSDYQAQQKIST
jgi:AraC-like DNA-binding protein